MNNNNIIFIGLDTHKIVGTILHYYLERGEYQGWYEYKDFCEVAYRNIGNTRGHKGA